MKWVWAASYIITAGLFHPQLYFQYHATRINSLPPTFSSLA